MQTPSLVVHCKSLCWMNVFLLALRFLVMRKWAELGLTPDCKMNSYASRFTQETCEIHFVWPMGLILGSGVQQSAGTRWSLFVVWCERSFQITKTWTAHMVDWELWHHRQFCFQSSTKMPLNVKSFKHSNDNFWLFAHNSRSAPCLGDCRLILRHNYFLMFCISVWYIQQWQHWNNSF